MTADRRVLLVAIDVTDLSPDQADALALECQVQAEASDDHPDAGPVIARTVAWAEVPGAGAVLAKALAEQPLRDLAYRIGGGFHPDTRGADYTSLPAYLSPQDIDSVIDQALADGVDVYAVASEVQREYFDRLRERDRNPSGAAWT